jgi:Domain of unknown function (DUF4412)
MKKLVQVLSLMLCLSVAASAQGVYYEYKITGNSIQGEGTIKAYAQDGNSRSEMHMPIASMPGGGISNVVIYQKAKPTTMIMLNEQSKSYSEMTFDPNRTAASEGEISDVTVVGKEKVNGFNSTHVIVTLKSGVKEELWMTSEIPHYESYLKVTGSKYSHSEGFYKKLADKGALGMPVRMKVNEHGSSMVMELVKVEQRNCPSSLFEIPAGYNKQASVVPGAPNIDYSKMQNMTPEERKKYIEEQIRNH